MTKASRKPSRETVEQIKLDLINDLGTIRNFLDATTSQGWNLTEDEDQAWAGIETFCAIALRIIAETNPSKVRDKALVVEIAARMAGRPVI